MKEPSDNSGVERFEARAKVFKGLAHPARLAMLQALARGERCVCELQELVGSDMSTVSKHLALLKETGVVSSRRQGNQAYYRLEMGCLPQFLNCVDAFLRQDLDARLASLGMGSVRA